jgi:death-on-curing protein
MESLANNHGFIDGNKRIAFAAAATFLELNGILLEVDAADGFEFIHGSLERHEFRFSQILDWIRQNSKPIT